MPPAVARLSTQVTHGNSGAPLMIAPAVKVGWLAARVVSRLSKGVRFQLVPLKLAALSRSTPSTLSRQATQG